MTRSLVSQSQITNKRQKIVSSAIVKDICEKRNAKKSSDHLKSVLVDDRCAVVQQNVVPCDAGSCRPGVQLELFYSRQLVEGEAGGESPWPELQVEENQGSAG